jgi:hypothetical protein
MNHIKKTMAFMPNQFDATRIFIWGYITGNPYCNNAHNMQELKTNISNITASTSPMTLQAVPKNTLSCAQLCMQHVSAHFKNF